MSMNVVVTSHGYIHGSREMFYCLLLLRIPNYPRCLWITMECSQPAAWTTNRSLLVASRVRPFQEDRPIPTRPYPELRTWMVVWSGVISVFLTNSGNAPASPDIRPTTWLCPACLPSTNSIPAPIQPTIAMTTTHIHQLWLTRPPSTRSSSASEDHPQAPVVTQQQQQPNYPRCLLKVLCLLNIMLMILSNVYQ